MEAVKLNNAKREAAHARAEADEASFQQREQIAQSKRLEERQNRRVMDGERERNRLRKLKAVEGREWDAEKKEEDFAGRGGNASQFRRGAHGGVAYDGGHNGRLYDNGDGGHGRGEFDGPRDGFAPRGPRGRGGRGRGRGRGRGEYDNQTPRGSDFRSQTAPTDNDFPALVGGGKGEQASTSTANWGGKVEQAATVTANANWGTTQATEPFQSPTREEGSWADQVESTVPAAPPGGW